MLGLPSAMMLLLASLIIVVGCGLYEKASGLTPIMRQGLTLDSRSYETLHKDTL